MAKAASKAGLSFFLFGGTEDVNAACAGGSGRPLGDGPLLEGIQRLQKLFG